MNLLGPTLVLYALAGIGVAAAVYLQTPPLASPTARLSVLLAFVFWPLYLPLLLARPAAPATPTDTPLPSDEMTAAILQVDRELALALSVSEHSDGGLSADVKDRFAALRQAWLAQADRIRAMDRLLASPGYRDVGNDAPAGEDALPDRVRESVRARGHNVERLRQVRHEAYDDLMARLAWMREQVSIVHLVQFSDTPPERARRLLAQIASCREANPGASQTGEAETGISPRPSAACQSQ